MLLVLEESLLVRTDDGFHLGTDLGGGPAYRRRRGQILGTMIHHAGPMARTATALRIVVVETCRSSLARAPTRRLAFTLDFRCRELAGRRQCLENALDLFTRFVFEVRAAGCVTCVKTGLATRRTPRRLWLRLRVGLGGVCTNHQFS